MEEKKTNLRVNLFWLLLVILNLVGGQLLGLVIDNAVARILSAQALILVPLLGYLLLFHENPVQLLRLHTFHPGSAVLVVLLAFCLFPIVAFCNAISMTFFTNLTAENMSEITEGGLAGALLIMALLPGVVEELTFRGVLMGSYDRGKRPVQAIVFSAFAFALMHMNFNQMCYAFILGIIMGVVVELTGSIFSSILIHFTINGTSTVLTWSLAALQDNMTPEQALAVQGELENAAAGTVNYFETAMTILPIALIAAGLCWLLIKGIAHLNGKSELLYFWTAKEYKEERAAITKTRIWNVPYGVAAAFCLVMCVMVELVARAAQAGMLE